MIDIETYNDEPNFSVIVPQKCDAKCGFCSNRGVTDLSQPGAWLERLKGLLWKLPPKFQQVSITGGEPTLYSYFDELMFLLRKRFRKVVVSTNGSKLGEMGSILKWANDINLSWHGTDPIMAAKAFGVGRVSEPDPNAIEYLRDAGTGVTLTWVITMELMKDLDFTARHIDDYVDLAERLHCSAAAFRFDMREEDGLTMSWVPGLGKAYIKESDDGCPVCRTLRYDRRGFPVLFKASCAEPAEWLGEPYELIYTHLGVLSTTWDGMNPVMENEVKKSDEDRLDRLERMVMELVDAGKGKIFPRQYSMASAVDPFHAVMTSSRERIMCHDSMGTPGGGSCSGGGHC
jgi:pyruvate-formate lyase-activating enzyme